MKKPNLNLPYLSVGGGGSVRLYVPGKVPYEYMIYTDPHYAQGFADAVNKAIEAAVNKETSNASDLH